MNVSAKYPFRHVSRKAFIGSPDQPGLVRVSGLFRLALVGLDHRDVRLGHFQHFERQARRRHLGRHDEVFRKGHGRAPLVDELVVG